MVSSHGSEGQGEGSKADESPENHVPILSPVCGFLGIWSVVTSLKLSDVMDKMRGRSGLDRFKVHLSLRKCHTVPPAASGTQKDHTVHIASYLMLYCCFLCPCRLLTENACLRVCYEDRLQKCLLNAGQSLKVAWCVKRADSQELAQTCKNISRVNRRFFSMAQSSGQSGQQRQGKVSLSYWQKKE